MPADITAPAQPPVDHFAARYANLVYRAAVRRMGGHGAEDVTQAVFLIALQKSKTGHLPEEPRMAGWLLKVTQYAAQEARRAQTRRHHHESAAATQHPEATMHHPTDHDLTESLDDALLKLRPLDRELLARRYLQNQPVHHLAAALNIPENTASQRLARALEKLRKLLRRQGILTPAAALTTLMLAESAKAVPATLALTAAGATGSTAAALSIAKGAATMMKITALKTALIATLAIAAALTLSITLTSHLLAQAAAPAAGALIAPKPPTPSVASPVTAPAPSDPAAQKLLDSALATIADQQKALKNLTVTGILKEEDRRKDGSFEILNERDLTVIYGGAGHNPKCRIDCRFSKALLSGGVAPYDIEKYGLVYDGNLSLKLTAPGDGQPNISRCSITAGPPWELVWTTANATGWGFSTLGWWQQDEPKLVDDDPFSLPVAVPTGKSLLTVLGEARKDHKFVAQVETEAGHELLKLTVPTRATGTGTDSNGRYELQPYTYLRCFWLDPQKNFAMTRIETRYSATGPPTSSVKVTSFHEPIKGLFFPKHIDTQSFFNPSDGKQPVLMMRITVDISNVLANTAVPDDMFKPEKFDLPEGTNIQDNTIGETVLIDGTPQEQQQQLNAVINRVRAQAEKQKGATTHPASSLPTAQP